MKTFLFVFAILTISSSMTAQDLTPEWVRIFTITNGSDWPYDITTDQTGNPIATGYFHNSSSHTSNLGIVKYTPSGNLQWTAEFHTPQDSSEVGEKIVVDPFGNVFVGGRYYEGNDVDMLLTKYDSQGNFLWYAKYDSASRQELVRNVLTDSQGNAYLIGLTTAAGSLSHGKVIKYNPSGLLQWTITFDSLSIYGEKGNGDYIYLYLRKSTYKKIVKLNTNGNIEWSRYYTNLQFNSNVFKVDRLDNLYLTGSSNWLVKFDPNGELLWSDSINNNYNSVDIAVDTSNNIYLACNRSASWADSSMLRKYSSIGNILWTSYMKRLEGSADACPRPKSLAVDLEGNTYVGCVFYRGAQNTDALIHKFNTHGQLLGKDVYGASGGDMDDVIKVIAGNSDGIYVLLASVYSWGVISPDFTIIKYSANTMSITQTNNSLPERFILNQNYPNPFNPSTTISFDLPRYSNMVSLFVYDALGRELKQLSSYDVQPGSYEFNFDARHLSSGVYYYSLNVDGELAGTKKMVIVK